MEILGFAPNPNQKIAHAYENVLNAIRNRESRHRQNLRCRYQQKLEQYIFEGLKWTLEQRQAFLNQWKENLFKRNLKATSHSHSRWKQCEGIDQFTAAKCIKYFVLKFISNPHDRQRGEIACILWILIWSAKKCEDNLITVSQVLNLHSNQIYAKNNTIIFDNGNLEVSAGLYQLLLCLAGEGMGKRNHRLFKNVNNIKFLERALHDASKEILGENCIPVLPASFLIFPHLYRGFRMPKRLRQELKNARQLVPFRHTRHEILASLKNKERL